MADLTRTYCAWSPRRPYRIAGYAQDAGNITLDAAPGRMYFVYQTVGRPLGLTGQSYFQLLDEQNGRAAVLQSRWPG